MTAARLAAAEFFGTLWLVLGGCGAAVLAAKFPETGVGFAGVALAFGLTVMTAAYAVGAISGGHFNPAVSVGLWAAGRFPGRDLPIYLLAQVAGAIAGAGILYGIASGAPSFDLQAGFARGWPTRQLWFFWVMPTLGGTLGGLIYRALTASARTRRRIREEAVPVAGQQSSPA